MSDPVPSSLPALSAALADAVAAASRAVVGVRSGRAPSSGFVWRPGLVVTADEALAEDGEVSPALPDGGRRRAAVAGRDPSTDVALLRADTSGLDALPRAAAPPRVGSLALLAEGASNRGIAERLDISVHTAKFHLGQVLDKLDATGRTDAVAHAARRGVIHL